MKTKYFLLLIIPLLLSGCSSMYIPSSKNVPLFENKNEMQIEAGVSPNSVYMTGSWAFTKKYALVVNGSMSFLNFSNRYDIWRSSDELRPSEFFNITSSFAHRYIEGGVGKYNILSDSKWKLEVFGGGGYGYALQSPKVSSATISFYENRYWMGFAQGNIGRRHKILEYGASLRLACSGFNFTYKYDPTTQDEWDFNLKFNNIHIEPLVFLKIGKGSIRGFGRIGANIAVPLKSLSDIKLAYGIIDESLDYTIFHLSAGISYRFGGKGKNSKPETN
jgi:hypothetical protein